MYSKTCYTPGVYTEGGRYFEWPLFQMGVILDGCYFEWALFWMGVISDGRYFGWALFWAGVIWGFYCMSIADRKMAERKKSEG